MRFKKIAAVFLTVCLLFAAGAVVPAEENGIIRNNATGIPDPALYAAALEAGDADSNGILTVEEAGAIDHLVVWDYCGDLTGVGRLTGLTNLEILDARGEGKADAAKRLDLSPLSEAPGLTDLYINGRFQDLSPLSSLTGLNTLGLISAEGFQDLTPLSGLTDLTQLTLTDDRPSEEQEAMDVSPLASLFNLEWLYLWGNITDISALPLRQIYMLNIRSDYLEDLTPLEGITNIGVLELCGKELSDLSVLSSMTGLWSVTICGSVTGDAVLYNATNQSSEGKITDISPLASLDGLKQVKIASDSLTDISPIASLDRLTELMIASSGLTDISPVSSLSGLTHLSIGGSRLTDISPLSSLTGLEWLTIKASTELGDISALSSLTGLRGLFIDNSDGGQSTGSISDLSPIINMKELEALFVNGNRLSTLPDLTGMEKLDSLSLYGNLLTEEELKAKLPAQFANDQAWIDANKYVPPEGQDPEQQPQPVVTPPEGSIPDNTGAMLEDGNISDVTVTLTQPDVADKNIFKAAKDNGKEIAFDVVDGNGNTSYRWTFPSAGLENTEMDLDLNISFETEKQDEIQSITGQQGLFYISFAHHGDLPGPAMLKIYVGDTYRDGDTVYLYYFNEEEGTIERKGSGLRVSGGYVEFQIDHCSDYFLTSEVVTGPEDGSAGSQSGGSQNQETSSQDGGSSQTEETASQGSSSVQAGETASQGHDALQTSSTAASTGSSYTDGGQDNGKEDPPKTGGANGAVPIALLAGISGVALAALYLLKRKKA